MKTLARLLSSQGNWMRTHPDFARLEGILRNSVRLGRVRLNRRAYALLDEPRLEQRNLGNFYSTYRLPESPFFELFLSLKWERRRQSARARAERAKYIETVVSSYPRDMLGLMNYVADMERGRNEACPVWRKALYPATKKRARELGAFTLAEWLALFAKYIDTLKGSYRRLELMDTQNLLACALLECLPKAPSRRLPSAATVKARFRLLCKTCHPDLGGDGRQFILIKKAAELLLDEPQRTSDT